MDRIYLIPGFFGFANLGEFRYFGPVITQLAREDLHNVHVVRTLPTASLRRRAEVLHAHIVETAQPGDVLHLVGHSSGGLDARLYTTPGVQLDGLDVEPYASRVKSVVTVCTPHHGTPSADVFTTVAGRQLLKVLSLMTILVLRNGGTPLRAVLAAADLLVGADKLLGAGPDMFDALFDSLLGELSETRRAEVNAFFVSVGDDQSLLSQLMPSSMDLFDATARDRDGVNYGSVVSRSDPPRLRNALASGLSTTAHSGYAWYTICWQLASRLKKAPVITPRSEAVLRRRWPDLALTDNDGMVPTLSQPYGELIRAVGADHLDVLGHFGDPDVVPPSYDWFNTRTGFEKENFAALWADVADFIRG